MANKFARALKHLKSSQIDERIDTLSEALPTNNTQNLMTITPSVETEVATEVTYLNFDTGETGDDGENTSGLFLSDGTILTIEPPGDTSYVLGPMSAMWYAWGNFTRIGYIRESDRKMVNLASLTGELGDWDGSADDFTSYGQLTLAQADWFRTTAKKDGADNDTPNYRAFYPGPPSNTPDEYGRYLCVITGTPKDFPGPTESRTSAPGQGAEDATTQFSALMNRLGQAVTGKKGLLTGKSIGEKLKDIKKFFGDHLIPPAAEYSTNIAKSILQNEPIEVKQSDIPKGDIDKFISNLAKSLHKVNLTVSHGNPTPYADDNIYIDANGKVQSNIGPNGEKGYYQPNQTGPVGDVPGGKWSGGYTNPLAAAGQGQVQIVYPTDGSEPYLLYTDHAYHNIESDDPGEVPDVIKAGLSAAVHSAAGYGQPVQPGTKGQYNTGEIDTTTPNTGAMTGYPPNIRGDVKTEVKVPLSQLPQEIIDRGEQEQRYQELIKKQGWKPIGPPETQNKELSGDAETQKMTKDFIKDIINAGPAEIERSLRDIKTQKNVPNKEFIIKSWEKELQSKSKTKVDANPWSVDNVLKKMGAEVDQTSWGGKPKGPPTTKFTGMKGRTAESEAMMSLTGMGMGLSPEAFEKKYGISPQEYLNLPQSQSKKKNKNVQVAHHEPQGQVLSEGRKWLREIRKPVDVPELPKKLKVKPQVKKKEGYKIVGEGLMKDQVAPPEFSSTRDNRMWRKYEMEQNKRSSQEKKNQVLEKIGEGDHQWNYMVTNENWRTSEQMKKFYGTHDDLYTYYHGGKKHKIVRKEGLEKDFLLFVEDENGIKDTILQSELNDLIAYERDQEDFKGHYLYETEQKEREINFDKVNKIKKVVGDVKRGELAPEYPKDPPPKTIDGWHPKLGKNYKHDKLDPQSAEAMPATGDPEIDANIEKATDKKAKARKVKVLAGKTEQFSNWRDELTDA